MVTNQTRQRKSEGYDPEGALERWIVEMCEVYDKPRSEIVNIALVKLEMERVKNLGFQGGENG